jgi:hypothetical protein
LGEKILGEKILGEKMAFWAIKAGKRKGSQKFGLLLPFQKHPKKIIAQVTKIRPIWSA